LSALGLAAPLAPKTCSHLDANALAAICRYARKSLWRHNVDAVRLAASLLCPLSIVVAICYAALCAASPFGTCRRCAGRGRLGTTRGLHSRPCRNCDATGLRIRAGRHLYNEIMRAHRGGMR
jgi:hypothetical protein